MIKMKHWDSPWFKYTVGDKEAEMVAWGYSGSMVERIEGYLFFICLYSFLSPLQSRTPRLIIASGAAFHWLGRSLSPPCVILPSGGSAGRGFKGSGSWA